MMPENESEKYFALLKRTLSGTIGKNLIDISFKTAQVADSAEHKLLMGLRDSRCKDEELRDQLCKKIIETVTFDGNYLILMAGETYDVPFKSKDDSFQKDQSEESYTFFLCAVCPVKQTKANLHYVAEEKMFHDGAMNMLVSAPALGFLFPAFDGRSTNIYNALMYSKDIKDGHEAFVESVFNVNPPKPAAEQKKSFEALLSTALKEDCSMDLVQTVHNEIRERIEMHKEAKVAEPLMISKEESQAGGSTYEFTNGRALAEAIGNMSPMPTAVFAANDMTAIGIIQRLSEMSVRVPEDISVAGFDNIEVASMVTPALTTANQSAYNAGFAAISILIDEIEEKPLSTRFCATPSLEIRSSTSSPSVK